MPYGTYKAGTNGDITHTVGNPLPFAGKPAKEVTFGDILAPLSDEERRVLGLHMRYAAQLCATECNDWHTLFETRNLATLTAPATLA